MYYIYQITNSVNGKRYIGKTLKGNPKQRWTGHQNSSKHGSCTHFHRAIRKWGSESFVFCILAWGEKDTDSSIAESLLIEIFKPEYNMTMGGEGTVGSARPKTQDWKTQHSKNMMGKNNPMFAAIRTANWRVSHSQTMKEFYKENPDKRPVGKKNGMFGKKQPTTGCPHCSKAGSKGNMLRWHFDNCKYKGVLV